MRVFFTGAGGAVGVYGVAELLAVDAVVTVALRGGAKQYARLREIVGEMVPVDRLDWVKGDVTLAGLGMSAEALDRVRESCDVIVHAAADTHFRGDIEAQRVTNVRGTENVLSLARACARLKHVVLVSTTCVAGTSVGKICEVRHARPAGFTNFYEQSKWEAENACFESGLPVRVVRLSTVVGERASGRVRKQSAFHHALQWVHRGLIPMVPGDPTTRVDFISVDRAACALRFAATMPVKDNEIWQIAAGEDAARLRELVEEVTLQFSKHTAAWKSGQIRPPMIVDGETFDLFRQMVDRSGDVLFQQVIEAVNSFLPGLRYPKVYDTTHAGAACGAMREDWRQIVGRMIDWELQNGWGRVRMEETVGA